MAARIPPLARAGGVTTDEATRAFGRMAGALATWECDRCHDTGDGDPSTEFAREEVEHCLRGCNGSLRQVRMIREGYPVPPLLPPPRFVMD